MLRICICLLAGAMAPQLISFRPLTGLIVSSLLLLLVVLPWCRRSDIACLLAGGAIFMAAATNVIEDRLATKYARESMLVTLKVIEFPAVRRSTTTFEAVAINDSRVSARMRLSWFDAPVELRLGDVWRMQVVLRRPRGNSNPGTIDTEGWLFRNRVGASGYVVSGRLNELQDAGSAGRTDRLRQAFLSRIKRLAGDNDSKAVLAAIVIGARHQISAEQWHRYARTGTSHLMAISGLHIGLAAMGAFFVARMLLGSVAAQVNQIRACLVVALLTAVAYAAISGFAVPAQRAVIMLCCTTLAMLMRRAVSPSRVLAFAAAVVLIANPLSILTPGFKLSFAAVALLFWFAQRQVTPASSWLHRSVNAALTLVAMQFFLAFGLLPLTGLTFDRVSLAAPFLNLVAVPLFSFITVPLALFGLVLSGPFAVLGDAVLEFALGSIRMIESLIVRAASIPLSSHSLPEIAARAWLLLLLPLAWVLLPRRYPGRYVAILGAAALLQWRPVSPPTGCLDATVLDVGQGLAIVVEIEGYVLLYDTGPSYRGGGDAADTVVLPYLQSRGIRRLDRIVVSHSDLDHAGGIETLVAALPVGDVLSGDPLAQQPTARCDSRFAWRRESARFSFLHPGPGDDRSGNNASCVLLIEVGETRLLLTGDIERDTEAQLVSQRVLPQVDIVTVPHHGSRTSSMASFVQSLRPSYAVVSAGFGNQWGMPKRDVVARWQDAGATVLNTATSGAIGFRLCASGELQPPWEFRRIRRRVWHDDPQYADN